MDDMNKFPQHPCSSRGFLPADGSPRKHYNFAGMMGLGLILLAICVITIAPVVSIVCWIVGMISSFVGLAFKPRWMAVIGAILSLIVIAFIILLILIFNNPGPPGPNSHIDGIAPPEIVADSDSLMLDEVEIEEIVVSDSIL